MSELRTVAEKILELAQAKRPLFADVRVQRLEGVRIFFREIWEVERISKEGLGLRVLTDKGLGFAASQSFADEDLKAVAERAFSEVGRGWPAGLRAILETPPERARVTYPVERGLDELSPKKKQERLAELLGRLEGTKKLRYHDHLEERVVMNSEGTVIEAVVPTVQLTVGASLPQGSFLRRFGRRGGLEVLLGNDMDRFFQGFKADQELLSSYEEVRIDENLSVLLDPTLLGMIIHDIGHSFEADFALADGTWVADKLNEQIGPDFLQVVDDPTLPAANASYAYDDEGSRAGRTTLIDRGVLKGLLHSRFTGPLFGAERSGNARTFWATDPVLVRMSNTIVATGDASKEELLRAEKRLIFLKGARFTEMSDHRTGEFKIALEQAFLVEDGAIVGRLSASSVAGNAQKFLKGLIALSSESEFTSSTCGKWGPENTLALVGQIAPYALVAKGMLKLR